MVSKNQYLKREDPSELAMTPAQKAIFRTVPRLEIAKAVERQGAAGIECNLGEL